MKKSILPAILILAASLSCSLFGQPSTLSPKPTDTAYPEPQETPPVLVDSFFYGKAYIDSNGNRQIDPDDAPLEGAIFTATDARGYSGGGYTDSKGSAMAWWPSDSQYPITLQMKPPKESGYTIIGQDQIVLQEWETSSEFLFTPPDS
jgi:hypothetical protein